MPQSLAKIVVHIVFSTKKRNPYLIDRNIRAEMHAHLGGICRDLNCPVLTVGGVEDHVHILCALARDLSIADVVGEIKRSSSRWIKRKGAILTKFSWQSGYGVFSVGKSEIERVKMCIVEQGKHHRGKKIEEEYRTGLKARELEYDERYIRG